METAIKAMLGGGNLDPKAIGEMIEPMLGILFTVPAGTLQKMISDALPNTNITVKVGIYQGKKALQLIIVQEA